MTELGRWRAHLCGVLVALQLAREREGFARLKAFLIDCPRCGAPFERGPCWCEREPWPWERPPWLCADEPWPPLTL